MIEKYLNVFDCLYVYFYHHQQKYSNMLDLDTGSVILFCLCFKKTLNLKECGEVREVGL